MSSNARSANSAKYCVNQRFQVHEPVVPLIIICMSRSVSADIFDSKPGNLEGTGEFFEFDKFSPSFDVDCSGATPYQAADSPEEETMR